ncbi:hypothetical protein GCM10010270_53340 [Streptomyces violaceus]|nr:hypothetical protein GCM10010270_53340 [Streptomyces janthinus]
MLAATSHPIPLCLPARMHDPERYVPQARGPNQHQEAPERERGTAGTDWEGKGYVFASPTGGLLSTHADPTSGSGSCGARACGTVVSMMLATPPLPCSCSSASRMS